MVKFVISAIKMARMEQQRCYLLTTDDEVLPSVVEG